MNSPSTTFNHPAFSLYPFQKKGVEFLASRDCALLADDMGLGKSEQAIFAAKKIVARRVLILCPLAVRHSWAKRINKYFPDILVKEIKKTAQKYTPVIREWVVCNYDIAWRGEIHEALAKAEWDVVVLDEAHYLKALKSKRTQGVLSNTKGIIKNAQHVWAMTGTPVLNRPVELYPLLHFVFPCEIADCQGYFEFTKKFCQGKQGHFGWEANGACNIPELSRRLGEHMLRRTKEEVFPDMPKAAFTPIYLEPSKVIASTLKRERAITGAVESLADRAERLSVGEAVALRRQIGLDKIAIAVEHLGDCEAAKVVVFAYHRDVANALNQAFPKTSVLYTGEQTQAQKQKSLACFVHGEAKYFIAQIEAAGTGIDGLQDVCSHAVFVELCYVPGKIDQAIGRLVRHGQTKSVTVECLVHEDSIDEDILKTLDKKRGVIDKIVGQTKETKRLTIEEELKQMGIL